MIVKLSENTFIDLNEICFTHFSEIVECKNVYFKNGIAVALPAEEFEKLKTHLEEKSRVDVMMFNNLIKQHEFEAKGIEI